MSQMNHVLMFWKPWDVSQDCPITGHQFKTNYGFGARKGFLLMSIFTHDGNETGYPQALLYG